MYILKTHALGFQRLAIHETLWDLPERVYIHKLKLISLKNQQPTLHYLNGYTTVCE